MATAEDDVDVIALRTLATIARLGSISAAARDLGVTQQAASARLRAFERRSGLELILRRPAGAELTASGRLVLAWAEEVLAASERLSTGIRSLAEDRGLQLRVSASQTIAGHLLPEWIVRLRAEEESAGNVATAVQLRTGNSDDVVRGVRDGACDVGFIESPRIPRTLASTTVGTDELVLVVAPTHSWAARGEVALSEVAAASLVTREAGSGTREAWEAFVADRLGAPPAAPALELASNAAVRSSISAGVAPGVLSALAVADDLQLGRLRRVVISGARVVRPLTALWRGGARDLGDAARDLLDVAARERRESSE